MGIQDGAGHIISGGITVATVVSSSGCDVTQKVPYSVKNSFGIYTVWCCLLSSHRACTFT